jgi:hypothetical protein
MTVNGKLMWRREDVERLIAYDVEIMWVKDQGTYLMVHKPGTWPDGEGNDVVYAYDDTGLLLELPEGKDRDEIEWDVIYETCREICGGDDFGEYLQPSEIPKPIDGDRSLVMYVSDDSFTTRWSDQEAGVAHRERTIIGKTLKERMAEWEILRQHMEAKATK